MQPPIDHASAAQRESRLLIGIAIGMGCLLLLCALLCLVTFGLALFWTLQGKLGPGEASSWVAPALLEVSTLRSLALWPGSLQLF